jgi:hypothetical protein
MPPVLFVPLGERRGHVHFLDDVAPAHARVIRAQADLAFLLLATPPCGEDATARSQPEL